MNNILPIFLLATLFFSFQEANASDGKYTFRDPIFPEKRISIDVREETFLVADTALKMSTCKESDNFLCLVTDAFTFYAPRKIAKAQREWSGKGHKYLVESIANYGILGWNGPLMRIRGEGKEGVTYFLFSKNAGLVAISIVGKDTSAHATYLLDGKCGYGAMTDCR